MSWRDRLPRSRGKLLFDEPLAPFTWLRVGGPADVLFLPEDEADLAGFLAGARSGRAGHRASASAPTSWSATAASRGW